MADWEDIMGPAYQAAKLGRVSITEAVRKRHPSSEKYHALLREAGETHDRKQADYGTDNDPFANIRASEGFGVPAWVGCMMRANDKMIRIMTASKKGKDQLKNESLRDSLMDLAVYSLIGIVLLEEELSEEQRDS